MISFKNADVSRYQITQGQRSAQWLAEHFRAAPIGRHRLGQAGGWGPAGWTRAATSKAPGARRGRGGSQDGYKPAAVGDAERLAALHAAPARRSVLLKLSHADRLNMLQMWHI